MKKFEAPVVEVERLLIEDVITTSICEDDGAVDCPNYVCPLD